MNKKAVSFIALLFYVFGFFLLGRLLFLQVADHGAMVALADEQQVKKIEIASSPRGAILDRKGVAITNDAESPGVLVFPTLVGDVQETAKHLSAILGLEEDTLMRKIAGENENGEEVRYTAFWAKSDLSQAEINAVEDLNAKGVFLLGQPYRYYKDTPMVHLLGQLGTVTQEDILSKKVDRSYSAGDEKGVSGIEFAYEALLRGSGGVGFGVITDEKNRAIEEGEYYVFEQGQEKGGTVCLTIDLELQRVVEAAFGDAKGACVILDAKNGDVLAMASSPKFDPTHMTENPEGSEVNKALKAYPPASLFKIFDAAVALDNNLIQPAAPIFCDGSVTLKNGRTIGCWKENGHGLITFDEALAHSCNPAFVGVGETIGAKRLTAAFKKWELDEDTLLGYPLGGLSSLDLGAATEGEIANAVLGEAGAMITPLNLAKMINVVASGGYVMTPRLVTKTIDNSGEVQETFPSSLKKRVIGKETAATVGEMMTRTFTIGTGKSLDLADFDLAGKTGSSETGNVWIGGFYPEDQPKYTMVILVENGSSGVGSGGPILKKICGYLGSSSF